MDTVKIPVLFLAASVSLSASPMVVNDAKLLAALEKGVGAFAEEGELPSADDLAKAMEDLPERLEEPVKLPQAGAAEPAEAVFVIGSVYKCGKCDRWHPGGVATAWALSADGLMVTNFHVIENAKGGAMAVLDHTGKPYPVTEVLAGNREADVALFRVRAENLPTLSLGEPAKIGDKVHVISHPNRRFFMHTFGEVARYHLRPARKDRKASTWMSITADYAKGSSGGPVLNADGAVVGMVASTQSIYYESDNGQPKGPLQMVVKNCVPVAAIAKLLERTDKDG